MAQQNISNGQTPLLVSDGIARMKDENHDLYSGTGDSDFLTPLKWVLPEYADAYEGDYYEKTSETGDPAAFPTSFQDLANGKLYEIDFPSDAIDQGISALFVSYGTNDPVPPANITEAAEADWVTAASNTTIVYWRQAGRKMKVYLPTAYVTTPKIVTAYTRFPTYPAVVGDALDVPAEDFETFFALWKAAVTGK